MRFLNKITIYSTAFITGFIVLALEVAGFRLFAPYFGMSVYVSGSLIAIVLIALSIGAYLGGILADKMGNIQTLYKILLAAAVYLGAITFSLEQILNYFSYEFYSPIIGTIISTLVIFALPMTILSMASPFLVKILVKTYSSDNVGIFVGKISSLSTAGSIIGTIGTTFILLPWLGTQLSLIVCNVFLFVIIISFLALNDKKYLALVVLPIGLTAGHFIEKNTDATLVFKKDSIYNYVQVKKRSNTYTLHLNVPTLTHSYMTTGSELASNFYYANSFLVGPLLAEDTKDILILGLGGGTTANQYGKFFDSTIETVEIDPVVVDVAEKYFKIYENNPDLVVHTLDARTFINKNQKKYDMIEVDMVHGGPYLPFYLSTAEFFSKIKNSLKEGGVMVMNVLSYQGLEQGNDIVYAVGNTVSTVYESVFIVQSTRAPTNTVIIGMKSKTDISELKDKVLRSKLYQDERLQSIFDEVIKNIREYAFNDSFTVLSDDHAPIEKITYNMFSNLKLSNFFK